MKHTEIEKSIIKKYRKTIWREFTRAVNEFNLINEGDKIAICISGGKDSFLLAKCMEELLRHGKFHFEIKYILMDPGYEKKYMNTILKTSKKLNIELDIFESNIFENVSNADNMCYLCARKRRGSLYSYAKKLGCNKIALGHHFYDVIETIIMSMIYNGEFKTMKPMIKSTNYEGMMLIRPLYFIKEEQIIGWAESNDLKFIDCACSVTKKESQTRKEIRKVIKYLEEFHKGAETNIMKSTMDVNLETLISIKNQEIVGQHID